MTTKTEYTLAGYDAAYSGAVVVRVPEAGFLRIAGPDRIDFIQRQTTNDARTLASDRALLTVLTSATARLLDVWRLVPDEDTVGVITLPGRGAATAAYLQRRIFFMDKVTVTDASAEIAQIEVFGPESAALLGGFGLETLPEAGAVTEMEAEGAAVRVIGQHGAIGRGSLLLVESGAADRVLACLFATGGALVGPAIHEMLRVEAGLPGPVGELIEDYTPLEMNLDAAISATKGCYTGQEVIARQITHDKVTRRLAGLRLEGPVRAGAAVQVGGRGIGVVTSAVKSPHLGVIALAVLRRPHDVAGVAISVVPEDGDSVPGVTVALPFAG